MSHKITSRDRLGTRVIIDPAYRPTEWQHSDTGTLFMVKGRAAYVTFDSEQTPIMVATVAIRTI
jgi:hypothetical protein